MRPAKDPDLAAQCLRRDAIHDAEWNTFIANSPQSAAYGCTWYLDAVWPGWQGIVIYYRQQLMAVMPVKVSVKYGISYIFNPPLCQYTGIFFANFKDKKNEREFALKKRLVNAVIAAIPERVMLFNLNFAPQFDYPQPFFWAGCELHTRYSYWLKNEADKQMLFKNLSQSRQNKINKARRSGLRVVEAEDAGSLIELSRKKNAYPLDYDALTRLCSALKAQGAGTVVEVRDEQDRLHAGLIRVTWGSRCINLFSAANQELNHLGAGSLALWYLIEQAGTDIEVIDFEGSMIEPVEHFFRSFGGHPVPFLQIRKNAFPKPLRYLFEK